MQSKDDLLSFDDALCLFPLGHDGRTVAIADGFSYNNAVLSFPTSACEFFAEMSPK